jgi:hypothetical protein
MAKKKAMPAAFKANAALIKAGKKPTKKAKGKKK